MTNYAPHEGESGIVVSLGVRLKVFLVEAYKSLMNSGLCIMRRILWPSSMPKNPHRICIHRVGQIGDIVCALPALRAIRRAFPSAELTLLTSPGMRTNPGARELLEGAKWLDNLNVYYSDEINSLGKIWAFAMRLRERHFDLWIALPQDLTSFRAEVRNILFARLAKAGWATGFRVNTVKHFAYGQARVLTFQREIEVLLGLVEGMGITPIPVEFELPIRENEAAAYLEKMWAISPKRRHWLALVPGGKRSPNRWPVERFAEIAKRWIEEGGCVLVLGGGGDVPLGAQIASVCGDARLIDLCGRTNLRETTALLKECGLLLTNDTGPMHLAAAVGTRCITVFSARDFPVKWYPWGGGHTVLRKSVACSPCLNDICHFENQCLTSISTDDVWGKLRAASVE